MKKRAAIIVSAFVIAALLFSCGKSTIKIGYNNIDIAIHFMVNRYFKLEAGQSEVLNKIISKHLYWIRKEGFKSYIVILTELKPKISGNITYDDILWVEKIFEKHQVILFKKIYPDAVDLIDTLDKNQISSLKVEIEKTRKKQEKELSQPKEQQFEKSLEGMMKMMKFIYGDFTDAQIERIRKLAIQLPDISAESARYNNERMDKFLYVLENRKGRKAIEEIVSNYFFSTIKDMPDYYRKKGELLKLSGEKFVLAIHNDITTPEQKIHAAEKLQEVMDALVELQAQP